MRTLKPGFFKNEDLAALPPLCRILFAGLWGFADREGRFEWRPKRIKVEVLPFDECDVGAMLEQLRVAGFIVKYLRGQNTFGFIPTFLEHQRPHKNEQNSVIPAAPVRKSGTAKARRATGQGQLDDDQCLTEDAQSLGAGKQSLGSAGADVPADAGPTPRKRPKGPTSEAVALVAWLEAAVRTHKPDFAVAGLDSAREFDRAIIAGVSSQRLMAAIDWVHRGVGRDPDFWKANALSGKAFRKQLDRFEVLMAGHQTNHDEQPNAGTGRGAHVASHDHQQPREPEPPVRRVAPAIARKAIKDALAASLGKPVPGEKEGV